MKKTFAIFAVSTMLLGGMISQASAITITGGANSTEGLGNFSGDFAYTSSGADAGQLVIAMTNTSPVANGGFLTAFGFNNPGDQISGVNSFLSTSASFSSAFTDNGTSASPLGNFDLLVSTGNSFLGGGSPNGGIAVGDTETFTLDIFGTGVGSLTENDFFSELSSNAGGPGEQAFVARFRGFLDGGSDKVPSGGDSDPDVIHEPVTLVFFGLGLLGMGVVVRRRC